jgi:hypothetical protein
MLYYVGIPTLMVGVYLGVRRSNITKQDCVHYSLDSIHKLVKIYNYIDEKTSEVIRQCTETQYKDLEIISKTMYNNDTVLKLVYRYKHSTFISMYDNEYPLYTTYNVGETIRIKDAGLASKKKKIVLIELVDTITEKTTVIHNALRDHITTVAGPNENFYKRDNQPIYITADILEDEVVNNIINYKIQITYLNMEIIVKQFTII